VILFQTKTPIQNSKMKREPYFGSYLRDPKVRNPYRDEQINLYSVAAWILLAILMALAIWVLSYGVFGRGTTGFVMPHDPTMAVLMQLNQSPERSLAA